ncbi:DUF4136 domain-containing protein [Acidipila sp. EB88]|uniref:DUF4136 domain-containing protein n=1 Tax=Acidipila sp. EB88 TaxID=2305226 RepID=UPI001315107F|nr:DUF4136 domain-containing protein [Acidipila sp. EB88]
MPAQRTRTIAAATNLPHHRTVPEATPRPGAASHGRAALTRIGRILPAAALLLFIALTPPAQALPFFPPRVTSEYDHSASFRNRTYSWGDARMGVPLYVDSTRALIDKDFKKRGWQLVPSGGSTTVFLLGHTPDAQNVIDYYHQHGDLWAQNWSAQGWGPTWKTHYGELIYNAAGTAENHIVFDIFDTTTHQPIFRAVTAEDLSGTPKKNNKDLERRFKVIFKQLPKK